MMLRSLVILLLLASTASLATAQSGYEYEVYSTHISQPGATKLELHSNFVSSGTRAPNDEIFSSHRALRSSLEIGHGLTSWFDGSVYFVGAILKNQGASYVGSRARLTAVAPSTWGIPLELGISQEIGYARRGFAENRWVYELSPIIGKTFGPVSLVLNPSLERGLGAESNNKVEFEPRAKVAYQFGDEAAIALEYFGCVGPLSAFEPRDEQRHQLFATLQTELSPRWEIGIGAGHGLTEGSERTVISTKIEYHFGR